MKINETAIKEKDIETYAYNIVDELYKKYTDFEKYGEQGYKQAVKDVKSHVFFFNEAVKVDSEILFTEYIKWRKILYKKINLPDTLLYDYLIKSREYFKNNIEKNKFNAINSFINSAIEVTKKEYVIEDSYLKIKENKYSNELNKYFNALMSGDRHKALKIILDAIDNGCSVTDIYLYVFQPFLYEIGRLWQINEINVAQEHYATAATQLIMSQLYDKIFSSRKTGKVLVSTCVSGELHEIGIRMISDFLEYSGWDTHYLGANTPNVDLISILEEKDADLLAISATMVFNISKVNEIINFVKKQNSLNKVKIIVGGYPFNVDKSLWKKLGADGYSTNAEDALKTVNNIIGN